MNQHVHIYHIDLAKRKSGAPDFNKLTIKTKMICFSWISNVAGINSRVYFAFVSTPSFFLRVITWLEPAIKSKVLNLSLRYGYVILVS